VLTGLLAGPASALPCLTCDDGGGGGRHQPVPRPVPTPAPPAPAPQPLPDSAARDVTLTVTSIRANNTEDIGFFGAFGANDEAYLFGVARMGTSASSIASAPAVVGAGRSITPTGTPSATAVLTGSDTIAAAVKLLDEDAGTDWNKVSAASGVAVNLVTEAMKQSGNSYVAAAGEIVSWGYLVADFFASRDQDDDLGTLTADLRVGDLPVGTSTFSSKIAGTWLGGVWGWSDWDYDVTYTVTVTPR
jgi:hypothetical protein